MSFTAFQTKPNHLVIIVGNGLVGSAISDSFKRMTKERRYSPISSFGWRDSKELTDPLRKIIRRSKFTTLKLIWAAGSAGFLASEEVMQREFEYYLDALTTISNFKGTLLQVNLISSAGGLYENSGLVTEIDDITPSRPYAEYKYRQEMFLSSLSIFHRIYRIASVYGSGGRRIGLINNLINQASNDNPTIIYANQNTLRDYIYNKDIGNAVATDVLGSNDDISSTKILATGRPTSVNSLLNIIRRVRLRPCVVSFRPDESNAKDIVFSPHLLEHQNTPTSVDQGVKELQRALVSGMV